MTKSVNFTKTTLDKLTTESKDKRTYYNDSQIKGLAFAVQPSGAKSFFVVKKIAGRSAKIFLGKYPDLSIENARKKAVKMLGQIADGINPQAEQQRARAEMTFGQLFDQYMTRYSKLHKKTWYSDQQDITRFCNKWFNRRLSHITQDDCRKLHEKVFAENGPYMANSILKKIRAVYNQADSWGWKGGNPTAGIKKYREKARDRFILPAELPHIIRSIGEEPNETIGDFFMLLLLTGARKTNAKMMRWEQVNWQLAEWRIPDTKNGEPVIIPLTEPALERLQKRHQSATSAWVFPNPKDNGKYLGDVGSHWLGIKERATAYLREQSTVPDVSMMDIRIHDLRRTFGSYQAISGASLQIIGKSLGHKSPQATQIYARLHIDPVRDAVAKATTMMLSF